MSKRGEWLVWMWQHYSLNIIDCEDLDEALSVAIGIQDNGEGSLQCIEGPDGVVPEHVIDAARSARDKRADEEYAARPKPTHGIKITSPVGEGRDGWWESWYMSRDEAEAEAERLRPRFGKRVKVVAL